MKTQFWKCARGALFVSFAAVFCGLFAYPAVAIGDAAAKDSASASEQSAATGVQIEDIAIGFGGYYKVGDWTSIRITLVSPSTQAVTVTVCAPDADDQLACLEIGNPKLTADVPTVVAGCFRTGRIVGDFRIDVRSTDGELLTSRRMRAVAEASATLRPALKQDVALWAAIGNPVGSELFLDESFETGREHRLATLRDIDQLPNQWQAYQSIDALFLSGSLVDENGSLLFAALTEKQNTALRTWVEMGGFLVVAIGSELDAWKKTPLANWLPVKMRGTSQLRRLDDVQRFAGRSSLLRFDGTVSAANVDATGTVLADGLDGPLIQRIPHGFGFVTFVGLDLNKSPLNGWDGLNNLFRKLMDRQTDQQRDVIRGEETQLVQVGVSDLATQLQFTQDSFPAIPRRPLWEVFGLMVLYILLIGPVDYLIVHRLLARPELTWVTFPLMVALAMLCSSGLASISNGNSLQATQVDVLDYDVGTETLRGRSWATLYSPEAKRYEVTFDPRAIEPVDATVPVPTSVEKLVSWSAAPENCVGGLYRAGGLQLSRREYDYGKNAESLTNLPISTWSTKSVGATWHLHQAGLVESQLEGSVGQLSGVVSHTFPFPLEDCMLAFGNRVFFPLRRRGGEEVSILAPHEVWDVGRQVQGGKRELRGYLTNVRSQQVRKSDSSGTEILTRQTPYDPFSKNRHEIVRMLTFHQAAGGNTYTGMSHALHAEMDFSQHLRNGKAVLFGRLEAPASNLMVNGEDLKTVAPVTFVRIILPVTLVEITPDRNFEDPGLGVQRPADP